MVGTLFCDIWSVTSVNGCEIAHWKSYGGIGLAIAVHTLSISAINTNVFQSSSVNNREQRPGV